MTTRAPLASACSGRLVTFVDGVALVPASSCAAGQHVTDAACSTWASAILGRLG
jgi:hypothetical protein